MAIKMMAFLLQHKKILYAVIFLLAFFLSVVLLSQGRNYKKEDLKYGITFSKKKAVELGLDWRKAYLAILDELTIKKLRISAYWDEIEPEQTKYFWDDLDWQISQAKARNVEVIFAVGGRLPRWPECHFPAWTNNLSKAERERRILDYIRETVTRYKNNANIVAWQVENEPFLSHFGECPELDPAFLDQEIALVREMDKRPIVITDSGELSFWVSAAKRADIFGTTMYRDTFSSHLNRYIHYPIGPWFFHLKRNIIKLFAKPKEWIVIELQGEPWCPIEFQKTSQEERSRTMSPQKFREMLDFAQKTGFQTFYLWGAEWWYWEKEVNKDGEMWEEARKIFNPKN
jgi:hypothetical protein